MTGTKQQITSSGYGTDGNRIEVPLLCFNDVYRVRQTYTYPGGHKPATAETEAEQTSKNGSTSSSTPSQGNGHGNDTATGLDANPSLAQVQGRDTAGSPTLSAANGVGAEKIPADVSNEKRGEKPKISVGQFGRKLLDIRAGWRDREDGEKDGLVLFAGDVFNPSVESSVTRGSHMVRPHIVSLNLKLLTFTPLAQVPIMNALNLDVACVGNHDFDFGYPHLTTLLSSCEFPWLLSNIVDTATGKQPEGVHKYQVFERCGVTIGVIGLVEKDWIATIPSWPPTFEYRSMVDTAMALSKTLRDPDGPHKVDLIVALTHCRLPNDVDLANALGAYRNAKVANEHGVDLLIGGHDHIGKGAESWQGFARDEQGRGGEKDAGVHLIKSGTDFRDLSEAILTLEEQPLGSVRRRLIAGLRGTHHEITPANPTSQELEDLVDSLLHKVSDSLSKPVCFSLTPLDVRSEHVRTTESAIGDFVADILLHAYAEVVNQKGKQEEGSQSGLQTPTGSDHADAVIICGGTLRGDSLYPAGKLSLGDILEIMPFEDPVVCLEIDGKGIWDTLESALSKWPAQEGRFPVISGLRVKWDHTKPPMQRVLSVHLLDSAAPNGDSLEDEYERPEDLVSFFEQEDGTRIEVKQRSPILGEEVKAVEGGRVYRLITRNYMAEGYDGFEALKNRKFIVDDETGQAMSGIVRSFLLGSAYIFRHKQLRDEHRKHRGPRTDRVLDKARNRYQSNPFGDSPVSSPLSPGKSYNYQQSPSIPLTLSNGGQQPSMPDNPVASRSLRRHVVDHSAAEIRDALHVARNDHMSEIDLVDGASLRCQTCGDGGQRKRTAPRKIPTPTASFTVDSSNRDEMRALNEDIAIVSPLIDGRLFDVSANKR